MRRIVMLFTADTPPPPELTGAGGPDTPSSPPTPEPRPSAATPPPTASQPPPPTIELELTDVGSTLAELERALAELEARPAPLAENPVTEAPPLAPEPAAVAVAELPPPSGPPLAGPGSEAGWSHDAHLPSEAEDRERPMWRTWQLAVAAGGALVLGLGLGGIIGAAVSDGGDPGSATAQVAALENEVRSLQDEVASQDQMIDDLLGLPGAATPPADEAEPSETAEPSEASGAAEDAEGSSGAGSAGDEIVVGDLTFAAIDVFEDFANDFEVRARMTHAGDDTYEFLDLTATILDSDGRILGVLSAFESDVQPGDTRTVSFIGIDDYTPDWAELEITVDAF
jgi:hypothetical protein